MAVGIAQADDLCATETTIDNGNPHNEAHAQHIDLETKMNAPRAFLTVISFAAATVATSAANAMTCLLSFNNGIGASMPAGSCIYLGTEEEMNATQGCVFLDPSMQFTAAAWPEHEGHLTQLGGDADMMMALPSRSGSGGGFYTFTGSGYEIQLTPAEQADVGGIFCYAPQT